MPREPKNPPEVKTYQPSKREEAAYQMYCRLTEAFYSPHARHSKAAYKGYVDKIVAAGYRYSKQGYWHKQLGLWEGHDNQAQSEPQESHE